MNFFILKKKIYMEREVENKDSTYVCVYIYKDIYIEREREGGKERERGRGREIDN